MKILVYDIIQRRYMKSSSKISAIAAYLPKKICTNNDFKKIDIDDEWVIRRTGIRERRIAGENEFSSTMAINAVKNLKKTYHTNIDDVDMIIVTTFTPDYLTPSVAALVQGYFDISHAGTMDLNAACTGFTYGLCVADALITTGQNKKILLIATESLSKILDYADQNTCILLGDAAVAMLLEESQGERLCIASDFFSDGKKAGLATCSNLSQQYNEMVLKNKQFEQDGRKLYEYVLKNVPIGIQALLKRANLKKDDIDWFVPHSANYRMIEALCKRLHIMLQKTLISNEFYGNTSSVSIPLALWMASEKKQLKKRDFLLLYGFGGGLTHGGVIIKW